MTTDSIEKAIRVIQREAEERLGFPLPPDVWKRIEEEERIGYSSSRYDSGPEEERSCLEEYEAVIERHITFYKLVLPLAARQLGFKPALARPARADNSGRVKRGMYRRPFERRLHLFDYIIDKKGGSISARANWRRIAAAWNEEHPHDPQTPLNLKQRYHEMIRDDKLTQAWIVWRVAPKLRDFAERLEAASERLRESATLMRDMPERLRESVTLMRERMQEMFAEHPEARTLGDLIRKQEQEAQNERINQAEV